VNDDGRRTLPAVAAEQPGPRNLRQLLDAVVAVGSELDLAAVLQRIAESAVSLVDAKYGALGVLDDSGTGLAQFVTVGIDDEARAAIGPLPKGLGVLGLLIADARPLRLAEITEHPASAGFPPHHPRMRSFLGVPVRVGDRVFGNLYLTEKTTGDEFTEVDEELVLELAAAAGVAINNAALFEEGRLAERERAGVQEVATALLGGTDTHEILELVTARAREIVDADLATLALPRGPDEFEIRVAVGLHADAVLGQTFPISDSITARILEEAEPLAVADLSRDPHTTQPQVRLGTMGPAVFVPLGAKGAVLGSLAVTRPLGKDRFTARDIDVLQQFATQASVVIEQGRAHEELHRLSLLQDQERIARDLHDTVIQRLFAIGLSLQGASRLAGDDEARRRIETAFDDLDTVVRHIRTVIFDVESMRATIGTLRRRVLDVAREAARPLGFQPRVIFDGPGRGRDRGSGRRRLGRHAARCAVERGPSRGRALGRRRCARNGRSHRSPRGRRRSRHRPRCRPGRARPYQHAHARRTAWRRVRTGGGRDGRDGRRVDRARARLNVGGRN
jgi:two-component system, NarL family, sensor histidine kinase DevS